MNRPRKPFQIHLSTALVLMFVPAGLVWLNVRKVKTDIYEEFPKEIEIEIRYFFSPMPTHGRGWPWHFQVYWNWFDVEKLNWTLSKVDLKESSSVDWDQSHLFLNILVALAMQRPVHSYQKVAP